MVLKSTIFILLAEVIGGTESRNIPRFSFSISKPGTKVKQTPASVKILHHYYADFAFKLMRIRSGLEIHYLILFAGLIAVGKENLDNPNFYILIRKPGKISRFSLLGRSAGFEPVTS